MQLYRRLLKSLLFIPLLALGLCQLLVAQSVWPGDPTENVAISRDGNQEQHPRIVSDGTNGAIIVWEYSTSTFGLDIMAQRVDAGGLVLWSPTPYITFYLAHNQRDPRIISDGVGGAIIAWGDERSEYPGGDIYVQRINSSGAVLWGVNGLLVCGASNVQAYPELCGDGAGGAIITWRDSRNYGVTGVDIYAQRVNAAGTPLWTPFGVPICTAAGNQMEPIITSDGSGGAVIAWMDNRGSNTNTYMQRVNASGNTQWTGNGVGYLITANATWLAGQSPIVSDGTGGAIVVYMDDYNGSADIDIRAVRVNGAGALPWSPGNRVISWAAGNQQGPRVVSDNAGGAIVTWTDYRYGTSDPDIYAQKVDVSGNVLWTGNGVSVSGPLERQVNPTITGDIFGGAIITWYDHRNLATSGVDVYAQRVDELGTPQWTAHGVPISTAANHQYSPFVTSAGTCGAIIAWYDYRNVGSTDWDIYAQRVFCDGALPIQLASFTGTVIPGRGVKLEWTTVSEVGNFGFYVQRRTENQTEFHELANSFIPGHGTTSEPQRYEFLDQAAGAGACFYRLRQLDLDGSEHFTDAIRVDALTASEEPTPKEYALGQNFPNPFNSTTTIRFAVPVEVHVDLAVYNTLGQKVAQLEDGRLCAGYHDVRFDASQCASGVYLYRLQSGNYMATKKLVLLR